MFFFLNGVIAAALLLYFGAWMIAPTRYAHISDPYRGSEVEVRYIISGNTYSATYLRSGIPMGDNYVRIRYFKMAPSISRVDSFLGIFVEPLGWWLVFFIASALLLLTPDNVIFRKGTVFVIRKSFPYLWMEEYFPAPSSFYDDPDQTSVNIRKQRILNDGDQ